VSPVTPLALGFAASTLLLRPRDFLVVLSSDGAGSEAAAAAATISSMMDLLDDNSIIFLRERFGKAVLDILATKIHWMLPTLYILCSRIPRVSVDSVWIPWIPRGIPTGIPMVSVDSEGFYGFRRNPCGL
jgi:hypothetical protein